MEKEINNKFFSLKNVCLICVLVAVYAASGLINAFFNNLGYEYIHIAVGVVVCALAWKCVSNIAVKWTLYAVSLYAVINNLLQIFNLYCFDPHSFVGILFFAVIFILGIRKTPNVCEKIDVAIIMAIVLVLWILNCLLRPILGPSPTASTTIYNFVMLLPFVAYLLLFVISFKSTSDKELKKSIALSLFGCMGLFILFFVAIIIGIGYDDSADIWTYHFDGYDWFDNEVVIMFSFFAGCLMSAYFIHLLIKSKYTMRTVCIPVIIGMICVGVLAAFTVGNVYRPESITYGLEYMSSGYAISSFGIYKLYKKL